tara:strand:- start:15074 stop:15841 length:768 start_codon:yes stop_codon:yes gene_type:complete
VILFVDIGNTRIKWAQCINNELEIYEGFSYNHNKNKLSKILKDNWNEFDTPDRVFVSNVASNNMGAIISNYCWNNWECNVEFLSTQKNALGLTCGYDQFNKLGIDRWLSMLGAWNLHKENNLATGFCVIDCGTFVTVDAVDVDGKHLGGLLSPGLGILQCVSADHLSLRSDKFTDCSWDQKKGLLATNTESAVFAGSYYTVISFIENIIAELNNEMKDCAIYFTGGDADAFNHLLSEEVIYHPNLVFEGMLALVK